MRISELQDLLNTAKDVHGDIEVHIRYAQPFGTPFTRGVNRIMVERKNTTEKVKIDEPLSELGNPSLVIDYVVEDDEKEETE